MSELRLARLLFLIKQSIPEKNRSCLFDFVPYIIGPYSFELANNLFSLQRKGLIKIDWNKIRIVKKHAPNYESKTSYIKEIIELYEQTSDGDLLQIIISKNPESSIFNKIAKKKDPSGIRNGIITIGYEGRTIDAFMKYLLDEKVQYLMDIRNNPWSMKYGYTKNTLQHICDLLEIKYRNIKTLGIPSCRRKQVRTKSDRDALFREFRESLREQTKELNGFIELGKEHRIALMCFERDPLLCHRSIVAEALTDLGAQVDLR